MENANITTTDILDVATTTGNITINGNISTSSTASNAITLNAGKSGGKFIKYRTSDDASIYAFSRKLDEKNEVLVILNLTPEDKVCKFTNAPIGNYTNYFTGKKESFDSKNVELSLKAWEYKVLTK